MYFDSVDALLAMDGHGPYVWSVYLLVLAVLGWLVLAPWLAHRRLRRDILRRARRDAATAVMEE
jgi:heme exporter protein D